MPDVDHLLADLGAGTRGIRTALEGRLREAIRDGRLPQDTRLPSTRELAASLGVSRGVVVEAYAQLVAEGWLVSRHGSGTRVAAAPAAQPPPTAAHAVREPPPAYDFALGLPDLGAFPRAAWLAALRRVLRDTPDAHLGHPDWRGAPVLRAALAGAMARVRGVQTTPDRVLVCTGFSQGLVLVLRVLHARGARRLAMEDPSFVLHRMLARAAGLEAVPVPVDGGGLRVDRLAAAHADAVLVTPAHQSPTGVVLAPERRAALLAWAAEHDAFVIEDDYDAEFRYDRLPVGALQGLAPERVVYGASASKTLAPALRLGWLALPEALAGPVSGQKLLADTGSPTLEQLVLADLLERGELDRHVRRMRAAYRARRLALVETLAAELPEVETQGISAGLHALVPLPEGAGEAEAIAAARARGVRVEPLAPHRFAPGPPGLLVGFAPLSEPAVRRGAALLAAAIRDVAAAGSAAAPRPVSG